jgi:hypothetical protein
MLLLKSSDNCGTDSIVIAVSEGQEEKRDSPMAVIEAGR